MSVRRARNAGLTPWLGLLFFVPLINLLMIALLCALPHKPPKSPSKAKVDSSTTILKSATIAVVFSSLFGVIVTAICVLILGDYGWVLFVGTPVLRGAIGSWWVNKESYRGFFASLVVGFVSSLLCLGLLVLFALEGIICVIMLAPFAMSLVLLGTIIGTMVARVGHNPSTPVSAMVVVLPIVGLGEHSTPTPLPVYAVVSEIHIDAAPDTVWPNVVGFSELPEPADWVLQTGIATPMRARIEGQGVGAIRYCEFTTGPFVEPITLWDPPNRLAFDVTEQPDAMHEWSPYETVYAPHIEDTMVSQRGEFQLIPTSDGGTLLRGTTWYTLDLAPGAYWRLWSDFVVHRIHNRVLNHIRHLSEGTPASPA